MTSPGSERRKPYPFDEIEPKWQRFWAEHRTFRAPNPGDPDFDPAKPKFYVLDMFPYPSGAGLHVGHPEGYTATDIIARYRRMKGFNVLHPMGWDAFGLPAEQYAVKTGQHPRVTTEQNVVRFREQLTRIGFDYDWGREVNTTDPAFFQWTQWIFTVLYNSWFNPRTNRAESIDTFPGKDKDSVRLAYVAEAPVNWCPGLGTVLANEEVIDGKSEVGGFPVERRPMRQWMLRITAYAQRLIDELDGLGWPESIKLLQKNWIGCSQGARIEFPLEDKSTVKLEPLSVFTTRPDTLFGATYMVLAPEHPMVKHIVRPQWEAGTPDSWKGTVGGAISDNPQAAVNAYRQNVATKSDLERTDLAKEKTGVFTGGFAVNPVNNERIPIWIADYVLMGYGTGAIMAVPAHDERDWEFAKKFDLPIRRVLQLPGDDPNIDVCTTGDGIAINSDFLDGLPTAEAKMAITAWLEEHDRGAGTVNYKLRDWLFSRQRYWGEPFPIVWEDRLEREGVHSWHRALDESELPVEPPPLEDFKPTGTAEPPLAKATDWVRYSDSARRETNTMPQWAGSSWYYLRFCDPKNPERFVGAEAEKYWMGGGGQPGGVDLYVGGTEHAVLHLLYARFWHKVLFDRGYVSTPEPFQRLVNQGLIIGEDGRKMSKRWGNVVDPLDVIADFGADSLRLYEMFMGPLEQTKPWSMAGVQGVHRFLARAWRLFMEENQEGRWVLSDSVQVAEPTASQLRVVHATIKKVTADIEALAFNTAISQMMVFVNEFTSADVRPVSALRTLLQVLNPFAPHITEELNAILQEKFADQIPADSLAYQPWPGHDEKFLVVDEIELPVQLNGKLRDKIVVKKSASSAEVEAAALGAPKIIEHLAGRAPKKVIVVSGKLVNIVA